MGSGDNPQTPLGSPSPAPWGSAANTAGAWLALSGEGARPEGLQVSVWLRGHCFMVGLCSRLSPIHKEEKERKQVESPRLGGSPRMGEREGRAGCLYEKGQVIKKKNIKARFFMKLDFHEPRSYLRATFRAL